MPVQIRILKSAWLNAAYCAINASKKQLVYNKDCYTTGKEFKNFGAVFVHDLDNHYFRTVMNNVLSY